MVRTRDLVLVVLALLVMLLAMSVTAILQFFTDTSDDIDVSVAQQTHPTYEAAAPVSDEQARTDTIERLRGLIAQGDVIESSPSVEAPETEAEPEGQTTDGIQCAAPGMGIDVAQRWPLKDVTVKVVGGNRVVSHVTYAQAESVVATGTPAQPKIVSEIALLQIPAFPGKQAEPVCPDTEIVGVTPEGALIFNADAVLQRNAGPDMLIGYARDGFPIYGPYAGEKDQCGGYESANGYRYAANPTEAAFLKCFVGSPRSFN